MTKWVESRGDKYTSFEQEKKKEKQYREYQRKLEQNRPQSPSKATKSEVGDPTASRKMFDGDSKQFKIVPSVGKRSEATAESSKKAN